VTLHRSNEQAEIVIRDTGEGIDPEFLPYVFDRFRRARYDRAMTDVCAAGGGDRRVRGERADGARSDCGRVRFRLAGGLAALPSGTRVRSHFARGSQMASVLEMQEHFWPAHLASGGIYSTLNRVDEAIAALERGFAVSRWNTVISGMLAGLYSRTGNASRAEALVAHSRGHQSAAMQALGESTYHYIRGEHDLAAAQYERVIDARYPVAGYYPHWICLSDDFRNSDGRQRLRRTLKLVT
jgi:hypothetical protein